MTAELEKHPLLPVTPRVSAPTHTSSSPTSTTPFHNPPQSRPTPPPTRLMTPSSRNEPLTSSPPSSSPLELSSSPHKSSSSVPNPPPTSSDPHYTSHWLCFYVLGLINNFHYVVVLSAAFSLASSFNAVNLIGVIQWATVFLGMGTKLLNTLYLLQSSYSLRILASTALCLLGLAMLTLSSYFSFTFAIVAICFIGAYSALGESVILGYLRHFHPRLTGAWSAGTGISGVAGTLAYLLLYSVLGLSNATIFLVITPTCVIYYFAFKYTENTAPAALALLNSPPTSPLPLSQIADDTTALIPSTTSSIISSDSPISTSSSSSPTPSRFKDAWRVARQVQRLCIHLTLVYFLEYVIIVGFASQSNPSQANASWAYDNAYEILSFCYQFGVLLSRSSISFVQISRIELITLFQALNFVLWFIQAWVGLMPLPLQFIMMVEVGIMGGAAYVNIFYILRGDDSIKEEERELAINVVSTVYYVGIISSSLVQIVLLNTILTRQQ